MRSHLYPTCPGTLHKEGQPQGLPLQDLFSPTCGLDLLIELER